MSTSFGQALNDPRVAIVKTATRGYAKDSTAQACEALAAVGAALDWADKDRGPLGRAIPAGSRVLIKPNFVMHENQGPWGIEPLITHSSIVQAAVASALEAGPSE